MAVSDGGVVPMAGLLQPKAEGEVAFLLRTDLDGPLDDDSIRAAVAGAYASIEIVDSRIAGWDIHITDTVADNASSGRFAISGELVPLGDLSLADVSMTLAVNGTTVSTGEGRACLGDPLTALRWLARTTVELGDPLRAGELVLSGALGPVVAVRAGDHVQVAISGLGTVSMFFGTGAE